MIEKCLHFQLGLIHTTKILGIPYENSNSEKNDSSAETATYNTTSSFDVEHIITALAVASAITAFSEYMGGKIGIPVLPIST